MFICTLSLFPVSVSAGGRVLRARDDRLHAAATRGRHECGEARRRGDGGEARRRDRLRDSIRGLLLSCMPLPSLLVQVLYIIYIISTRVARTELALPSRIHEQSTVSTVLPEHLMCMWRLRYVEYKYGMVCGVYCVVLCRTRRSST